MALCTDSWVFPLLLRIDVRMFFKFLFPNSLQIVIEGKVGRGYLSDIAIDGISFRVANCDSKPPGAAVRLTTTPPPTTAPTTTESPISTSEILGIFIPVSLIDGVVVKCLLCIWQVMAR